MKDEKNKKKTTTKKPTAKKTTTKKAPTKKATTKPVAKAAAKKKPVTKQVKKTTPKKVEVKKSQTKKVTKKNIKPAKAKPVKVEKNYESQETQLEKTLIFDGKHNDNLEEVVTKLEKDNVVLKDKVVKRSKARKVIITILALLIVAVIVGTAVYTYKEITKNKIDNQTTNSNIYEKVTSKKSQTPSREIEKSPYEHIQRLSLKEFEDKVKAKEDMAVIISVETCARCVSFEPIADKVFGELDKTLYEIDVTQYSSEEIKTFRTYYSFTQTPTIFYLRDGIVFNDIVPTVDETELRAWVDDVM
jgi:hypothetical protein